MNPKTGTRLGGVLSAVILLLWLSVFLYVDLAPAASAGTIESVLFQLGEISVPFLVAEGVVVWKFSRYSKALVTPEQWKRQIRLGVFFSLVFVTGFALLSYAFVVGDETVGFGILFSLLASCVLFLILFVRIVGGVGELARQL